MVTVAGLTLATVFSSGTARSATAESGGKPAALCSPAGDRAALRRKVADVDWAAQAYARIIDDVRPLVERHKTDPKWIVSRLAMYWREGEHYDQIFLERDVIPGDKLVRFGHGTGNAPVPTVRLPGMRVWNDYRNVPLALRLPYNESGDMLAYSRAHPDRAPILVPYRESGHLVRDNNAEILGLAEKAAFVYRVTADPAYARFATDIFNSWLIGTYYMKPPLDPQSVSGGPGGYAPGGILGYYDYEQIHDEMGNRGALIYELLSDYIDAHPSKAIRRTGQSSGAIAREVFRRFVRIGLVRGGKSGNWNINGWTMILNPLLQLEPDRDAPEGRGREYYLKFFTHISTPYHDALPDILNAFDPHTGLWKESPGYAFGVTGALAALARTLQLHGVDIFKDNPLLNKASGAMLPWMDARGNLMVFGDGRGGSASFTAMEALLAYYRSSGDDANAALMSEGIEKGLAAGGYDRAQADWMGICTNVSTLPADAHKTAPTGPVTAYSEFHRHIVLRNGEGGKHELMATLYGGRDGAHLSKNGLAMQLYGDGWALAPDASAYESYWSADAAYHQSATGSNTVVPGYTDGPITINALDPSPDPSDFTSSNTVSPYISFADVSAGSERRTLAVVRTTDDHGFYFDAFRSRDGRDYIYHNIGAAMRISDVSGKAVPLTPNPRDFNDRNDPRYAYFTSPRGTDWSDAFIADWTISGTARPLSMRGWFAGESGRRLFQVDAPATTLIAGVTPDGVSKAPNPTPTLIWRRSKDDSRPFLAIFEPFQNKPYIKEIRSIAGPPMLSGVTVRGADDLTVDIMTTADDQDHAIAAMAGGKASFRFRGIFGARMARSGFLHLYLGRGHGIQSDGYRLESATDDMVTASMTLENGVLRYSARGPVRLIVEKSGRRHIVPLPPASNRVVEAGSHPHR